MQATAAELLSAVSGVASRVALLHNFNFGTGVGLTSSEPLSGEWVEIWFASHPSGCMQQLLLSTRTGAHAPAAACMGCSSPSASTPATSVFYQLLPAAQPRHCTLGSHASECGPAPGLPTWPGAKSCKGLRCTMHSASARAAVQCRANHACTQPRIPPQRKLAIQGECLERQTARPARNKG